MATVHQVIRTKSGFKSLPTDYKLIAPMPSTALILARTNDNHKENELCMVTKSKRTTKANYHWSGSTVFPGGLTDFAADGQFVNFCQKYYSSWCRKYNFKYDDIMYRINGLRELFEETGILLCKPMQYIHTLTVNNNINYPIKATIFNNNNNALDITEWRYKVMKDPFEFENIFKTFNILPDILSLVPWARIQTPWLNKIRTKRWDVRFYLSVIDKTETLKAMNGDSDSKQIENALGKEIVRIDWMNIIDGFGKKQKRKFKTIPPITSLQLAEFYQIIEIEKCLLNAWKNAYVNRDICVLRAKFVVKKPDNSFGTVLHGDYLYDELIDGKDVKCDVVKENDPKFLQRTFINTKTGKRIYRVLNEYNRLYPYKSSDLRSKL
eukprot:43629_1